MNSETIGVKVTFGAESVQFHLRLISLAEEAKLREKLSDLTDTEREKVAYQNNVDLLASLSVKMPDGEQFAPAPESVEEVQTEGKSPARAIQNYFKNRTVVKERIAEYAVRAFFIKLVPSIDFS